MSLKFQGRVETDMAITRDWADGQIVFLGERSSEEISASDPDRGARRYVPPIVFLSIDSAPSDVC